MPFGAFDDERRQGLWVFDRVVEDPLCSRNSVPGLGHCLGIFPRRRHSNTSFQGLTHIINVWMALSTLCIFRTSYEQPVASN